VKVTVSPLEAVAATLKALLFAALGGGLVVNVIACAALPTVKLCALPVTAASAVVAVALALSVQVPTPTKLTELPDAVHTLVVLDATDSVGDPVPE
jgi:hypothetical protein